MHKLKADGPTGYKTYAASLDITRVSQVSQTAQNLQELRLLK